MSVLFHLELGGITKHLMTGPMGNSEICFHSTSMFPSASPRGTLRVSGKQNSLFPSGPVIKCLIYDDDDDDHDDEEGNTVGHFRAALCLCFKTSPRAKPFI